MLWRFAAILLVATGLLGAISPAEPQRPSFDCAKATRPLDRFICGNADLARADAALAVAYKARMGAMRSDAEKRALKESQRAWLTRRDALCPLANGSAAKCLASAYAERLAQLNQAETGAQAAGGAAMDDAALTSAHPAERNELDFPQGMFSRDGTLFAFSVSQIASGDADQIWLYRLSDRKLVPATPSPVRGKTDVSIDGFYFVDDTLYVQGSRGPHGDVQSPFARAITISSASDTASAPKQQFAADAARDTTAAGGDALADQGDKREEDAHYRITSLNLGHGALTLTAEDKRSGRRKTLATDSWNLEGFVFDAPRARVIYPDGKNGLVVYDLAAGRARLAVTAPVAALLDVTHDGRLAAFSGNGVCKGAAPQGDEARRKQICFAVLD